MKKVFILLMMMFGFVSVSMAAEFGVGLLVTDVNFEWTANTEDDLGGYNIYRSETSGVYDSTKQVGTVGPAEVQFVDVGVGDGVWYWVATAFDTAGNESGYSVEATATLDTEPPAPPQNFSIFQK